MRFKVEVLLAFVFGGLALTGRNLPVLGYFFLGLAALVWVDIIIGKMGYELKLVVPIRWQRRQSRKQNEVNSSEGKLNKLTLVAKAIMDAKLITPSGKDVTVYITNSNGLTQIYAQEIKDILITLRDDDKVITMKSFPDWLLSYDRFTKDIYYRKLAAIMDPSENHFVVDTLDTFDKWYETITKSGRG